MPDPVRLAQWLQAQGFAPTEGPVLHSGAGFFSRTFERDEGEDAIPWVAQLIATPSQLEISFLPYCGLAQWPQARDRLAALVTALFEHHGLAAPPLECLAPAWPQLRDVQLVHAGISLALEVPEAEPDQGPDDWEGLDFLTLTVRLSRPLAGGEWARWHAGGPLQAQQAQALSAEQDMIAQCRRLLRAHQHPLADSELRVLITQDATCILKNAQGLSLHLSLDEPSLSIVHADGRVETLA